MAGLFMPPKVNGFWVSRTALFQRHWKSYAAFMAVTCCVESNLTSRQIVSYEGREEFEEGGF